MSIHVGSPTQYGGPLKVFWEKILGALGARSMGYYTRKVKIFGQSLKRACKCGNRR